MAKIEFKNVSHSYNIGKKGEETEYVIKNLNLVWESGSAEALLGPSGCGKTTLLNLMSGLLTPTSGQILFDGKDVTKFSPKKRHIAQVFQFPVVYDSMSVLGNLAFPLRNDKVPTSKIKERVAEIAEVLGLESILNSPAGKLGPAEKQKVSLGRGLIRFDTAAVLLDEPLTVIDPKLQWDLRRQLKEVQKALDVTMIYVTHDQHEALTFADRVTVMAKGGIVSQVGTPEELHFEPETPFVGYFIGSPGMNFLDFTMKNGKFESKDFTIPLSSALRESLAAYSTPLKLGIRPEYVKVSEEEGGIPFRVHVIEDTGSYKIVTLVKGESKIKSRASKNIQVKEDETLYVEFPEAEMKFFQDDKRILKEEK